MRIMDDLERKTNRSTNHLIGSVCMYVCVYECVCVCVCVCVVSVIFLKSALFDLTAISFFCRQKHYLLHAVAYICVQR